jgi:hypothetical protein
LDGEKAGQQCPHLGDAPYVQVVVIAAPGDPTAKGQSIYPGTAKQALHSMNQIIVGQRNHHATLRR